MSASVAKSDEPVVEVLSVVGSPPLPAGADATTVLVTLPPGSAGSPPHRHPGPAFGYVIEGELRLGVEGHPERVVKAGESFWEPGGDVIHYQDANNLSDRTTKFVVNLFGVPGQELVVPVPETELQERRAQAAQVANGR
jgi:quercetin dioxygenase-like cupin family protein